MNWFRENAFLAGWLALPLAAIFGIIQLRRTPAAPIDWFRVLMYFAFLVCLAAAFTPSLDESARSYGRWLASFLIGAILLYKGGPTHDA
jgi:Na+-transporting NADH:ubiquinone oxidoreductase subunit NqrB